MYITRGITRKWKGVYTATVRVACGGQEGGGESPPPPMAEAGGGSTATGDTSEHRGKQPRLVSEGGTRCVLLSSASSPAAASWASSPEGAEQGAGKRGLSEEGIEGKGKNILDESPR